MSRALHGIGELTSRAGTATVVTLTVLMFLVALAIEGFPANWEAAFGTFAAAVTLVMVFVIQHTQSRQQTATQLKLDELIRSTPHADDLLVHIEAATEQELLEQEQRQLDHHHTIRT